MSTNIIALIISFVVAVLIAPVTIKYLISVKFGQEIREIGPAWHSKKRGTPTMGGFIFIIATVIAVLANITNMPTEASCIFYVLLSACAFGAVGFVDDFIKVVMKRNLGLTSLQKFSMQLLVTIIMIAAGLYFGIISDFVYIPFIKGGVFFGWLYIPFIIFVILGTVNSVNLTDGVDGLATLVTIAVMAFFAITFKNSEISIFTYALMGGLLGFLLFNKNPAKVFMGDTGSLFLGGAVAALAAVSGKPILLILVGFVYFAEALSVIIQVAYFKKTGKRIFKMSPIHHHFEMCGWNENKIVLVFTLVTIVLSAIALLI